MYSMENDISNYCIVRINIIILDIIVLYFLYIYIYTLDIVVFLGLLLFLGTNKGFSLRPVFRRQKNLSV